MLLLSRCRCLLRARTSMNEFWRCVKTRLLCSVCVCRKKAKTTAFLLINGQGTEVMWHFTHIIFYLYLNKRMVSEYFAFKCLSHDNTWVNFTLKWDLSNGEARSKNDFVLVFFIVLVIAKTKIKTWTRSCIRCLSSGLDRIVRSSSMEYREF